MGKDKKKRKLFIVVFSFLILFVFVVAMICRAIQKDEKHYFEDKYNLTQYNTDKYAGEVEYDTQGAVPEADMENAGTEGTDWGEGTGIFSTYTNDDGSVLWRGVSKEEYDNMSAEEKKTVEEEYSMVENKILGGTDRADLTEDTTIEHLLYNGSVYENIASLCLDYNEGIPFSYKGRSYAIGFNLQTEGYDNTEYPVGSGYGLDGPGYLIWLYRNALGYTPEALKGAFSYKKLENNRVDYDELQIGDICATAATDTNVVYGVVAGFSDGIPIVSVCNNDSTVLFPYGCNHLVYIKSVKDEVLGNYEPIDFTVFYRLDELKEG